jgi:hypothetical protein
MLAATTLSNVCASISRDPQRLLAREDTRRRNSVPMQICSSTRPGTLEPTETNRVLYIPDRLSSRSLLLRCSYCCACYLCVTTDSLSLQTPEALFSVQFCGNTKKAVRFYTPLESLIAENGFQL